MKIKVRIKVSEATEIQLNWLAGIASGFEMSAYGVDPSLSARVPGLGVHAPWKPTYYWKQGGPIIERERISVLDAGTCWGARIIDWGKNADGSRCRDWYGPTPLIAALRCYVASKLGKEVEIPEGLE